MEEQEATPELVQQRVDKLHIYISPEGWARSSPATSFDKFTERARRVLVRAQEEAQRLHHGYLGTEHLLLGLVTDEEDGIAAQALANRGLPLALVRTRVLEIIGQSEPPVSGPSGLTPRAKHVLALAVEEAKGLKHRYVGTEHLLLGLLREGEGIAARVLHALGLTLEQARDEVTRILGGVAPSPKSNVVMCRLDDRALEALDVLIEGGVRSTRSDAVAWLVQEGIEANAALFTAVTPKVAELRRLREETRRLAEQAKKRGAGPLTPPSQTA